MNKLPKLKIVAMSDLHGYLPVITEPADIAVIAGDIIPLNIQFNSPKSQEWYKKVFAEWIAKLPVEFVYVVGGNHDAHLERLSEQEEHDFEKLFDNKVVYLRNESAQYYDSVGRVWTIFGTPYCKIFGDWPFMRSTSYMQAKFEEIPDIVDIIISHDPPFKLGDCDLIKESPSFGHVGNAPLAEQLKKTDYKILFCGHIHSGEHQFNDEFKTVNVSLLNESYKAYYEPLYIEIEKD
ncbi:MAG: metallophosphoesterase family protein [Candidatus Saccharimonadaceae bacterium]